jgi:hypothetical protein
MKRVNLAALGWINILVLFGLHNALGTILLSDGFETYTQPSDMLISNGGQWSTGGGKYCSISTTEHHSGSKSLELSLPITREEISLGPHRYFSPKHTTLFCRAYIKYASNFNLAIQSSHKGIRFSGSYPAPCIKTPSNGSGFFLFLLQNNVEGDYRIGELSPGFAHIYAYWPLQRSNCGDHWYPTGLVSPYSSSIGSLGDWLAYPSQYPNFHPLPNVNVPKGQWFSYELMVKLNDIGKRNGEVKVWLDGKVVADFPDLFIRSVDHLMIDTLHLVLHAHHSEQINRMWFDDVVVSTEYIGP